MNYNNVKQMLNRFYAGETSPEEEGQLKRFFASDDVPESLRVDQLMFQSLQVASSEPSLGAAFDEKVLTQIEQKPVRKRIVRWSYAVAGLAAGVLILISLWIGGFLTPQPYGTIDNPQLAFAQTRAALQKVSKNLNKGLNPVKTAAADFNKPLNKVAEINKINKSLKDIKRISEMEKARQLMQSINSVYINLQPNQKKQ